MIQILNIKKLLLLLFLSLTFIGSSYADFQDGADAASEGNYKKALEIWLPLAEQGHSEAQFQIARIYGYALGVKKNDNKHIYWLRKSDNNKNLFKNV